jgi:hypothetical protein
MTSLRNIANCIGVTGNISIIKNFFCYTRRPPASSISLLRQVKLLKGKHIDLNLIHVGSDSPFYGESTINDIATAILTTRDTYAQVNIGIARINYYFIPIASANGHETIESDSEAKTLTREWTVYNDAFDVFLIIDYNALNYTYEFDPITGEVVIKTSPAATVGLSARDGLCDKNSSCLMTGSVVSLELPGTTGDILAHEVGHYLGLHIGSAHSPDPANLMFESVPNNKNLNTDQGSKMAGHCFVKGECF